VGHGLWTAVLGGLLFLGAARGRWLTWQLVIGYVWISFLHALWDSSHEVAVVLTFILTGTWEQVQLLRLGYLPPATPDQVTLFTVLSIGLLVIVALLGLLTLWATWYAARAADRQAASGAETSHPPLTRLDRPGSSPQPR
jgi:hypothetical protein